MHFVGSAIAPDYYTLQCSPGSKSLSLLRACVPANTVLCGLGMPQFGVDTVPSLCLVLCAELNCMHRLALHRTVQGTMTGVGVPIPTLLERVGPEA
jgi:hypothetical protein